MQVIPTTAIEDQESLIVKMVPYIMTGRYSEGLDNLGVAIPEDVRMNLVYETVRRVQLSNVVADNSDFAEFPVKNIKVGKLLCKLDRIGQKILQQQLEIYQNRYTVGVVDACHDRALYQEIVQQELAEKRKTAYSIPYSYYPNILPEQPAIVPNFKVHSQQFYGSRHVKVVGLSRTTLLIEDKEQLPLPKAMKCKVVFPAIINKKQNTDILIYEFVDSQESPQGVFVSRFYLSKTNSKEKIEGVKSYIKEHLNVFPLVLEQEEMRCKHALERDLVIYNSPLVPVFCHLSDETLEPVAAMMTEANQNAFPFWRERVWFPEKERLKQFNGELQKFGNTIYLKAIVDQEGVRYPISATLRELVHTDTVNQFITACDPDSLMIIQCHLVKGIEEQTRQLMSEELHHKDAKDIIGQIDSIVYCQNVTPFVGRLISYVDPGDIELPERFREHHVQAIPHFILGDSINKRAENRFHFENTQAKVYVGPIASVSAEVVDVSRHGLRLKLIKKAPVKIKENVRVTVKSIKLTRCKYRVVEYHPQSQTLRLKVARKDAYRTSVHLEKLFKNNALFYRERNTNLANKQMFDVLFRLSGEHNQLPFLTLKSGLMDYQKLSRLFIRDTHLHGFLFDEREGKVDVSAHLSDEHGKKLDSKHIQALTMHNSVIIACIEDKDTGETKPFPYQKLDDHKVHTVLQKRLLTGRYRIRFLTYIPHKAERPLPRLQNQNLALLSNLDREAVFMARGFQYEISHVVAIEDLSAIYTVCVNYDILIKPFVSQ